MRKINVFLSTLAIAGMLIGTSCSREVLNTSTDDNLVSATFTLNSPEQVIATRADIGVGDGTKVDKVVCATFDMYGTELTDLRQYLNIENKTATYSIRLVKGQNYRVAFFAYHASDKDHLPEYYDITDLKNIQVLEAASNIEERDAFTAYFDVETGATMQPIVENITLYRPFAQLNLGSNIETDWNEAIKAGVQVANTKIVVSNVYTTFSAFADEVVGNPVKVEFGLNTRPLEMLKANDSEYIYLALNYLLVGDKKNEKNLTDVEFIWQNADKTKTNDPITVFHNIPVQRNYRTNILGNLLTNPADFNIKIDADFEKPDYNIIAVDGTQDAEDVAENATHPYVDEGKSEIAVIENMHITADGTAIVIDEEFDDAPSGTVLVSNSTINADVFMQLDQYYTIIVRRCHLNVEKLFNITTGKTAYQFIFSDCYMNGVPMTKDKKNEYFTDQFLSLNTVNIYFNEDNGTNIPEGGENPGEGGENPGEGGENPGEGGENPDEDGENPGEGGENPGEGEGKEEINMSDVLDEIGSETDGVYLIKDKEFDVVHIDSENVINGVYYFENVTFNDYIYVEKYVTVFFKNCTFSQKGLVINKTGDITVQIMCQGCQLSNGETVKSKDLKGSGW